VAGGGSSLGLADNLGYEEDLAGAESMRFSPAESSPANIGRGGMSPAVNYRRVANGYDMLVLFEDPPVTQDYQPTFFKTKNYINSSGNGIPVSVLPTSWLID
jgi:hypothetical protein